MRLLFIACLIFSSLAAISQSNSLGAFTHDADIGRPKNAGSSSYDSVAKSYIMKGSGYNIWFNRDEFHYLYNKMSGDFILTASFKLQGDTGNAHRKFGWMARESEDAASASMNAVQHGDGLVVMQWRGEPGANIRDPEDEIFFPAKKVFQIIQLERKGKLFTMKVGNPGEPLQLVGSHELPLANDILAGLFICSHDENRVEEVKVWDVKIEKPKKK